MKNRKFNNCHKGRKCYVLGNAPSLNKIDFEKLEKEYVFTVNENYTSYKWLMDGKTLSGWNSNSAVIYDDEYTDGMYTLTVIVTDSEGNRKSATAQVYID